MNPLLQEALGSIVRAGLQIVAGYVVAVGIWTPEDASKYVAAGALAVVALGWSLYQKYASRGTLLSALASPKALTENKAKQLSGLSSAPSITTAKHVTPG